MSRKLVLFGTRQIAEVLGWYFKHDSDYEVVAHTVDAEYLAEDSCGGLPVVAFGEVAAAFPPDTHDMFVALSYARMNAIRAAKYSAAKALGYRLAGKAMWRARAPPPGRAWARWARNSFVMEHNVVQPFSRIGCNTFLWAGNHIGHHAVIGDHCFSGLAHRRVRRGHRRRWLLHRRQRHAAGRHHRRRALSHRRRCAHHGGYLRRAGIHRPADAGRARALLTQATLSRWRGDGSARSMTGGGRGTSWLRMHRCRLPSPWTVGCIGSGFRREMRRTARMWRGSRSSLEQPQRVLELSATAALGPGPTRRLREATAGR